MPSTNTNAVLMLDEEPVIMDGGCGAAHPGCTGNGGQGKGHCKLEAKHGGMHECDVCWNSF